MRGTKWQNLGCVPAAIFFTGLCFFPGPVQGRENILRLLLWEGYAPQEYVEKFEQEIEKKYGRKVKLAISYGASPDDFYGPIRDKSADLVTISHHMIKDERFNYIKKKLILPFNLQNIPNYTHVIPALKLADYHVSNGKIYGIPLANGPYGLAYNTGALKATPQSWKIFWDPAFKNKYVIGEYEYIYNVNITALVLGYPRAAISSYDALNNGKFKAKLRQLAVNANSLWGGVDKPDDLAGMSFATSWGDSLSSLKRRGEIWKMAEPVEGTLWWVDEYVMTGALADQPFLKKVAEEWIDMSLSVNFQVDHLIREVNIFPVIINISDELTAEEKERVLGDTHGDFRDKHILQTTYSQRDRNGLKVLWNEALSWRRDRKKED